MEIISLSTFSHDQVVAAAVQALSAGKIVIYPTETVYGIGVDATNSDAVSRLLEYKSRREGKPLSIAVCDSQMAGEYVEITKTAQNLYDNFLPGPLTVVSRSRGTVAPGVASEMGTVGVRIPAYPLVTDIIRKFGKPITSTSANASYQKRPYSLSDIFDNLSEKQKSLIDLVIDGGVLPTRDPSTVVDATYDSPVVLRQGEMNLQKVSEQISHSSEETRAIGFSLMKQYMQYLGCKSVVFALEGKMGAGKTEITKGIANALGIVDPIQSPTFIIEREYSLSLPNDSFVSTKNPKLYHSDTWRLGNATEFTDLGFYTKVQEGNVFVVEWADRISDAISHIKDDAVVLWISMSYGEAENDRKIIVSTL